MLTDPQMFTEPIPAPEAPEKALSLPSSLSPYLRSTAQPMAPASPDPKTALTTKLLPLIETAREFSPQLIQQTLLPC